jgi:succinate dehydrogenase hydrophobic anchor subunit
VIVEDYVHTNGMKVLTLMTLKFLYVLCAGIGMFAILRVTLGFSRL